MVIMDLWVLRIIIVRAVHVARAEVHKNNLHNALAPSATTTCDVGENWFSLKNECYIEMLTLNCKKSKAGNNSMRFEMRTACDEN